MCIWHLFKQSPLHLSVGYAAAAMRMCFLSVFVSVFNLGGAIRALCSILQVPPSAVGSQILCWVVTGG